MGRNQKINPYSIMLSSDLRFPVFKNYNIFLIFYPVVYYTVIQEIDKK